MKSQQKDNKKTAFGSCAKIPMLLHWIPKRPPPRGISQVLPQTSTSCWFRTFKNYFFIETQLIYNVVLISVVPQKVSVNTYIHSFKNSFPLWFIPRWIGKIPWRRKQLPTPVFLPGESHGQRSLVGYRYRVTKSRTQLSHALCSIVGPCCLSTLYVIVCICCCCC